MSKDNQLKSRIEANKLHANTWEELNKQEEKVSKEAILSNYETLIEVDPHKVNSLQIIHKLLLEDVYNYAGTYRTVNISKNGHTFSNALYVEGSMNNLFVDFHKKKNNGLGNILELYCKINDIHPFREGNGRVGRIWLNLILEKELGEYLDYSIKSKEEYMAGMIAAHLEKEYSVINSYAKNSLVKVNKELYRNIFMKNIDASYRIDNYHIYKIKSEICEVVINENFAIENKDDVEEKASKAYKIDGQ